MMKNLNSFLTLGWFLDYQNKDISIDTSNIDKQKYKNIHENELIQIGSQIWEKSITQNFERNQKHLVPISGGLDSRAILAGLLKYTEAKNIYTYTFGMPNTLDYDIGSYIANKLGTNHTSFDLTQHTYSQDELENISNRVDFQTVLFHHPPVWKVDEYFKGCRIWSGFMGDPLAGSKLSNNSSSNLNEEKNRFILKNQYVSSLDLTNGVNFQELIQCNCIDLDKLSLYEQLDFQNRQVKYIAPHVLMKGYDYKLPFLYQPWIDFMLSIDNKHRENQCLYEKILLDSFPKAFSYKTKTYGGLPLEASKNTIFFNRVQNKILRAIGASKKNKWTNYLDFNEKIRTKKDLRNIVKNNVIDLKKRGILDWIDIETILNDHLSNKGDFSDALRVLVSLEIHLKSGLKL